jgi:hypothetical protein
MKNLIVIGVLLFFLFMLMTQTNNQKGGSSCSGHNKKKKNVGGVDHEEQENSLFNMIDKNNDGNIDVEEFNDFMNTSHEHSQYVTNDEFNEYKNHDHTQVPSPDKAPVGVDPEPNLKTNTDGGTCSECKQKDGVSSCAGLWKCVNPDDQCEGACIECNALNNDLCYQQELAAGEKEEYDDVDDSNLPDDFKLKIPDPSAKLDNIKTLAKQNELMINIQNHNDILQGKKGHEGGGSFNDIMGYEMDDNYNYL